MQKSNFKTIALNHNPNHKQFQCCPDQFVGNVKVTADKTGSPAQNLKKDDFAERIDLIDYERPDTPIVILILESPHFEEYAGNSSPRPAAGKSKGKTGYNIRNYFSTVISLHSLPQVIVNVDYPLILFNAIQYQCSLGVTTSKYRNRMFLECWNSFGRNDLKKRLTEIYEPGDIIINACTKGDAKQEIRRMVKTTIDKITGKTDFQVFHPSDWMRKINIAKSKGLTAKFDWV